MNKITVKELQGQGISKVDIFCFKLYHTEAYNKFISQYAISKDIAINRFKDKITKGVYHYV